MRIATIVLVAYLACTVVAAIWRLLPFSVVRDAVPELGAVTAAYLGLTARRVVAPSVGAAVVLGYLVDIISGSVPGLMAFVYSATAMIARQVQQRILVRGPVMTIAFSAFVAIVSLLLSLLVRVFVGAPHAGAVVELEHGLGVIVSTALIGPLVWRMYRRVDAAFARTHRERDAALEGLAP